jgi:thiamine pyrophosphokinase
MKVKSVKAWLLTPQSPDTIALNYASIAPSDLIIAIDGGLQRCFELKLCPHLVIGDFDSLDPSLLSKIPDGCDILKFPVAKDETDTQLAVQYCLEQGVMEIVICNDLTGRFDHALALVQNLMQAHRNGITATLVSDKQIVSLIDGAVEYNYPVGTLISLLSLSPESVFSNSTGLKYCMDSVSLYNWQSRGISNEVIESRQSITLHSGLVLVIVTPVQ